MGTWTSEARTGWSDNAGEARWQFNLSTDQGDNNWGFGLRPSELQGLPAAAFEGTASDVQFTWTREAGTFRFTGSIDSGRGSGRYQFAPSEALHRGHARTRLSGRSRRRLLRLAVLDVTRRTSASCRTPAIRSCRSTS